MTHEVGHFIIITQVMLEQKKIAQKTGVRIVRLFESLEPRQIALLNQGTRLARSEVEAIALNIGAKKEECLQDIESFLSWRSLSRGGEPG